MQFSADFVALGLHQADVHRAEREIGLRMRGGRAPARTTRGRRPSPSRAGRTAATAARPASPCGERDRGRGGRDGVPPTRSRPSRLPPVSVERGTMRS